MAGYYGITSVVRVSICMSVCRTSVHPSIFSFPDHNMSKCQWIFTKLGVYIDIVVIWFGIIKGQISSIFDSLFVCVEVLRPSQPNGVMSSAVSLPNHTFTGQALSSKRLTSIVHILSPENNQFLTELSARSMSKFSFLDDNFSKCQWISTKLGVCLDIVKMWFGIADEQISSILDSYLPMTCPYFHFWMIT